MHRTAWQVILCVTALMLLSTSSGAQSPATSFDELRRILVPGQEVIVTGADGRRTAERVLSITESSLEVRSDSLFSFRVPGPARRLTESSVIRVRRVDSLQNGVLIGSAVGFGLGVANCRANQDCVTLFSVPVLVPTLIGGAVGATIDAVIKKTVYLNGTRPATGRTIITLSPLINAKTTGASVSLRF